MKKKIRDLTLGKLAKICNEHKECNECPLYEYCPKRYVTPDCMTEALDHEIKL